MTIAVWLRLGTFALITVALLAGYGAAHVAAALGVLVVALAAHAAFVTVSFVVSRRHAWKAQELPGLLATIAMVWQEWLAHLVLFCAIQPFDKFWMGNDAPAPGKVSVLLVHGYMCNRGIWWRIAGRLKAAGLAIATVNLEPARGDIESFAEQLHTRIEALCSDRPAAKVVIITHSMGGLVARAYLRRHGGARVVQLITLGAPHHGTWVAYYGIGTNARQMQPDSAWLRDLAQSDPGTPTLSVWSALDNFVAPQDSSRLAGAREQVLLALGHLAMLFSPRVLEILLSELSYHGRSLEVNAAQELR
jgi:triacylglycerol lipase